MQGKKLTIHKVSQRGRDPADGIDAKVMRKRTEDGLGDGGV